MPPLSPMDGAHFKEDDMRLVTTEQKGVWKGDTWECIDNHGNYFTTNSLTAIGQHVIAFWLLDETNCIKENNDIKGETDYEQQRGTN